MRARTFFAALFLILLAARLCHVDILWAEEDLPMAAAAQMKFGKALYRDVWFDKPPLLASIDLAWGARPGWPLRLAGAIYALVACALAYAFARDLWSMREGFWAAALLGFFLIFDFPSAVIPLAADLSMLAPHLAAVWLAYRGRAFWSGVLAGVAFLLNTKAVFVLAACAVWCLPGLPLMVAGFLLPAAIAAAWLASAGALVPYIDQVWRWGFLYAGSTFLEHPVRDGIVRTADWLGFHAALVAGVFGARQGMQPPVQWKLAAWAVLSFAAAMVGWRFFPRYYFQLLPVMVIVAARGMVLMKRWRIMALALLLIPLIRFGPRYFLLARDLAAHQPHHWSDVALDQDSRDAAGIVVRLAHPDDTLFVWGFRPDLWVYTRLPAATRFLDSQPLTGVPADRHLTQSAAVEAEFTRANREELARSRPTFVMDGLSRYNPALAMDRYPELRPWLAEYQEVGRTKGVVVYRMARAAP
ncbi:MAG: glycosyltransferase family 39 protein [Acidobacteriia bacterium]|nr:glycosyltransferase family 39 protein [Terriglobia bacterium]